MTKGLQSRRWMFRLLVGLLAAGSPAFAGDDLIGFDGNTGQYTGFSNQDSIRNTRHNLTQSTLAGLLGGAVNMAPSRNNYGQVCVYCHTPHAANVNTTAPLWNRTVGNATYTVYSSSTMNGFVDVPGASSLPCLSCHDGTQAVDAIINMPGSGRYNATPSSAAGVGGDLWTRWNVIGQRSLNHGALRAGGTGQECLSCHSNPGSSASAVDFSAFALGTDLTNDHPIGVPFPTVNGAGTDWKTPGGTKVGGGATITYFDEPGAGSGRLDKGDIRLFGAVSDARVECASCHDPHGVPSAAAGSVFNATFLRKTNDGSAVCLTCHTK